MTDYFIDMKKIDRRYKVVHRLIEVGAITTFLEVFDIIPKTVVAHDLGMGVTVFSSRMKAVENFSLRELFRIGNLLELEEQVIVSLTMKTYDIQKKLKSVM